MYLIYLTSSPTGILIITVVVYSNIRLVTVGDVQKSKTTRQADITAATALRGTVPGIFQPSWGELYSRRRVCPSEFIIHVCKFTFVTRYIETVVVVVVVIGAGPGFTYLFKSILYPVRI